MKIYPLYVSFRNVALPFRWKLYKPFFKCPVPPGVPVEPSVTSSQVTRPRDDHGVFKITPNMGTLPPNESVDFMLEFAPREVLKIITVIWSSVHTTPEEFPWKRSFIPTVRSTVRTNPSWKRSFFKPEEFEHAGSFVFVFAENVLKTMASQKSRDFSDRVFRQTRI